MRPVIIDLVPYHHSAFAALAVHQYIAARLWVQSQRTTSALLVQQRRSAAPASQRDRVGTVPVQ